MLGKVILPQTRAVSVGFVEHSPWVRLVGLSLITAPEPLSPNQEWDILIKTDETLF